MSKRLLNETEAAIHLGITKELLYAYIKFAPKKHLNHNRKLISIVENGKNLFKQDELNEFDKYLKKPWSEERDRRPDVPKYIQEYLKTEIGGKCPITGKGFPLENAHIEDYHISRSHHHHNLIRIAKDEHTKADAGIISKDVLKQTKISLIERIRQNLRLENSNYTSSIRSPNPHHLFIGRDLELVELVASMEVERLIIVEGIGGIGKTQLLLNAINNVKYHNPVLWIDIETISTVGDLIILLSNEVAKIKGTSITGLLIDALSSIRVTIVLDCLEKLLIPYRDETEDFIQLLMMRTESVQLLITSQIDLSIFDQEKVLVKLDGISDLSSKVILDHLLNDKIKIEEQQLQWILGFCGGHPLSLKLTSSLINFYKETDKAIYQLEKTDSLKKPLRIKHNKSSSLSICLDTVYSTLNEDQRKILHLSKFFPIGVKRLWAESKLESSNFDSDLAILQQFFMLEVMVDILDYERIMTQNPIRKFLYDCSILDSLEKYTEYEKDTLLGISIEALLVDHNYIETSINGSAEYGIMRMESELPNIMEAFHTSQVKLEKCNDTLTKEVRSVYRLIIGNIASSLGKFFFVRGFFEQGISMAKEGIKISLEQEMFESAATQYMYLSQIQSRQYDIKGFETTIKELSDLAKSTGDDYAIICSYWLKGRFCSNKGEYKTAMKHFNKVIKMMGIRMQKNLDVKDSIPPELKDSINIQEKGNIGLVYSEIGRVHEFSKDYEKALKYYKKGLDIQLSLKDEVNAFSCYYHVANCYIELKQPNKAIEYYFICVEGFQRHGHSEYLANTLAELGRLSEIHPEVTQSDLLTESVFENALGNLAYRLHNFVERQRSLNVNSEFDFETVPHGLIGQMILLIMLTSLSEYKGSLSDWAIDTTEKLECKDIGMSIFSAIINLAHAVGSVDNWKRQSEKKCQLPVNTIIQSCLIINGGPDLKSKTRIFYWLAQWMRYTEVDKEATAEKLWDNAWNSFE